MVNTRQADAAPNARHSRARIRCLLLAALMCGMTMVGAQLSIPLPYVKLTLQTFFVMLSGMILGPVYGPLSQAAYVLLGLAGLPVFSEGGGLAYIFKPTFGYLLGYPVASAAIGRYLHGAHRECGVKDVATSRLIIAGVLGLMAIFIPGVFMLYMNLNFLAATPISWQAAVWSGFLIFIPGDVLKLTGAIAVYRMLQRLT